LGIRFGPYLNARIRVLSVAAKCGVRVFEGPLTRTI
jgi:hypothetical protein